MSIKNIFIATVLSLSVVGCIPVAYALDDVGMQMCQEYAGKAMQVQADRQSGKSIVGVMKKYTKNDNVQIIGWIVSEAYDWPRFSQDEVKLQAIKDFSDYVFNSCYKELNRNQ